ncbi:MAG: hypothetical protein J5740_01505, partial [Bacteroidales bacterium]|nr:hypothetical protein [Bacteroidales bacterium]
FVIAAMLLCCSLAIAQEADELGGSNAELSVIARAEYLYGDPLGNSSLYTLLEGNISDNFSYSISNHWLSSDPGALYVNTLRADDVNWLDWAYLTYSTGSLEFSVGKDALVWGTYEMDEYDWDIHYPMASSMWFNLPIYQWGVRASWLPFEGMSLDLRASSSPYGGLPFDNGLFTYGARARYEEEDAFGVMVAYNLIGAGAGNYTGVLSAGAQVFLSDTRLVVDFNNKVGDETFMLMDGFTWSLMGVVSFADQFELLGRGAYERVSAGNLEDISAAIGLNWLPMDWLRVHGVAGYRTGDIAPGFTVNVGVTCNLHFDL